MNDPGNTTETIPLGQRLFDDRFCCSPPDSS